MSEHGMCGNRVEDEDGTVLGCMRSAGHWTGAVVPHHDASESRSWVFDGDAWLDHELGRVLIWDGDGGRRSAAEIRNGRALPREV